MNDRNLTLASLAVGLLALYCTLRTFQRSHRGRKRGGLGGLGAAETVHSHEAGRALLLAEKAAHEAEEAAESDDCEAGYNALARARTALATAHAHAASLDRPIQAIHETAATGRVVIGAERSFRRGCLARPMFEREVA